MSLLRNRILPLVNTLGSRIVDYPFEYLPNQIAFSYRFQSIPNTVIQTWEENAFGKRHLKSINQFRKLNSDMNFELYDKYARDTYMQQFWGSHPIHQIYERAVFGALKADLFRYCIVFERGGYYFDISKGLNTSISSLHSPIVTGFISFEGNETQTQPIPGAKSKLLRPEKRVIQWGFGFAPKHEVLSILIGDIVERFPEYDGKKFAIPKIAIIELSGPAAMTRALNKYLETNSAENLAQLDVDFAGHGLYSLPGSGARHHRYPSYAKVKDSKLFSEPSS